MLILTRRAGETIQIGGEIAVTVLEVDGDRVKLGVSAPRHITVLRQELCEAIKQENRAAADLAEAERAQARALAQRLFNDEGRKAQDGYPSLLALRPSPKPMPDG